MRRVSLAFAGYRRDFGQKKLLTLIILEILSPGIMVLDEFKNGPDIDNLSKFKEFLEDRRKKSIILLSGHDEFYIHQADRLFEVGNMEIKEVTKEDILRVMKEKGLDYVQVDEK